uniref:SRA1/Sec31 domain-containing protein n=1 Tax=Graphocephala atropunctata TaxID=36148 RepID=A0A1B6LY85_9HEMI
MEGKGNASCDPGWNDPPLFSYECQTTQRRSSKPRNFLNKRVAFPLHESPPSNHLPVDPTAPLSLCNKSTLPPPPSAIIAPGTEIPCTEGLKTVEIFNPSEALQTVLNNLTGVLNSKFECQLKDKTEIQRRLDIMEKMWIDDKLCQNIQQKLVELSEALKENETERADELQKGLMVDHAPACSQWMSGVRHLIHWREPQPTEEES